MTEYEQQVEAVKQSILARIFSPDEYAAFLIKQKYEHQIGNEWVEESPWFGERKGAFVVVRGFKQ